MLSPGQVLQDLLLNDPGHAGAAARDDGRRVAVASSAVKRRPLTSPRRGGRMRPPWRSPAPSRLSELRRDPTHPRGTAAASAERRGDSSPLARLPAARGARGQGWGARRRGRARRGAGRAATDGRARGRRLSLRSALRRQVRKASPSAARAARGSHSGSRLEARGKGGAFGTFCRNSLENCAARGLLLIHFLRTFTHLLTTNQLQESVASETGVSRASRVRRTTAVCSAEELRRRRLFIFLCLS